MRLFILLFSLAVSVSAGAQRLVVYEGKAQGTYFIVKYLANDTASLSPAIDSLFGAIDRSLSLYREGSLINRFNAGSKVRMDEHMRAVVEKALYISKATQGAFDITVKPLVDLWGFGVHRPAALAVPSADTLRSVLQRVGYRHLKIRRGWLIKRRPGIEIDCNGIAQGYTTDVLSRFLEKKGVHNYLVDVGGELRSKGVNQHGKTWTVGIERPGATGNASPVQAILRLPGKAITTSGNYRRFFDQGGTRFAHTIDPVTGQAQHNNIISVAVIAPDAITADGFDNALLLMGVNKALDFISRHPAYGLEAYFIYKDVDGKVKERYSKGFPLINN